MKCKTGKILVIILLIFMVLFSICPKSFATNGNEMIISSKTGVGNTIEIISGNSSNVKSESVADVVSYLSGQNITVNSIVNHKGASVELTSTALIGTGYVLDTNNGTYSVIVYGDANGDGEADAGDMKIVIDNFLGIKQASPIAKIAVDLYQDGDLDAADLKQVLDSFLGNLTGSILKTASASNPTPTPEYTPAPTPVYTPIQEVTNPQIKIGNQTITLTQETAPEYYGKVVTNYSASTSETWRIFYVDFDGKYGNPGTIYLKADQTGNEKGTQLNTTASVNSSSALNKMKEINPDWAVNDGIADETREHAVLWLCDESKWTIYKNNEKANSAIGAPSLEMYIDSYNQYNIKKGTTNFQKLKCKCFSTGVSGYRYAVGENNENYIDFAEEKIIEIDENNMYMGIGCFWWIASPSSHSFNGVSDCIFSITGFEEDNSADLGLMTCNGILYVCPLVSLKTEFIPEITN